MIEQIKSLEGHKIHSEVLFDNGYELALLETVDEFAVRILVSVLIYS